MPLTASDGGGGGGARRTAHCRTTTKKANQKMPPTEGGSVQQTHSYIYALAHAAVTCTVPTHLYQ